MKSFKRRIFEDIYNIDAKNRYIAAQDMLEFFNAVRLNANKPYVRAIIVQNNTYVTYDVNKEFMWQLGAQEIVLECKKNDNLAIATDLKADLRTIINAEAAAAEKKILVLADNVRYGVKDVVFDDRTDMMYVICGKDGVFDVATARQKILDAISAVCRITGNNSVADENVEDALEMADGPDQKKLVAILLEKNNPAWRNFMADLELVQGGQDNR